MTDCHSTMLRCFPHSISIVPVGNTGVCDGIAAHKLAPCHICEGHAEGSLPGNTPALRIGSLKNALRLLTLEEIFLTCEGQRFRERHARTSTHRILGCSGIGLHPCWALWRTHHRSPVDAAVCTGNVIPVKNSQPWDMKSGGWDSPLHHLIRPVPPGAQKLPRVGGPSLRRPLRPTPHSQMPQCRYSSSSTRQTCPVQDR